MSLSLSLVIIGFHSHCLFASKSSILTFQDGSDGDWNGGLCGVVCGWVWYSVMWSGMVTSQTSECVFGLEVAKSTA